MRLFQFYPCPNERRTLIHYFLMSELKQPLLSEADVVLQSTPILKNKKSSATKIVLLALLAVLFLGGIGVALYFFVFDKKPKPGPTTLAVSTFALVTAPNTIPGDTPSAITVTSIRTPVYGYFNVSDGTFASGTANFDSKLIAQFSSPSQLTTNSEGGYWFPLDLTAFERQNISDSPVSLTLIDAATGSAIPPLSSVNSLALTLSPALQLGTFVVMTTTGTVPTAPFTDVAVTASSFPLTLFGYFSVTAGAFTSGSATYNTTQQVSSFSSPTDTPAITTDNNGNYWFVIDASSFLVSDVAASNVTLSLVDAATGIAVSFTSSNKLSCSLSTTSGSWYWFQLNFGLTSTSNDWSKIQNMDRSYGQQPFQQTSFTPTTSQATRSATGSMSTMIFTSPQTLDAGSQYSAFESSWTNFCYPSIATNTNASYISKFVGSNNTCWSGLTVINPSNGASCAASYQVEFPSYPNGKGPYITGGVQYTLTIHDDSMCP